VKNDFVSREAAIDAGVDEEKTDTTNTLTEVKTPVLTPVASVRERYKQYQLLIENNFDKETVLERYLSAFTHSYDPHSDYLSPRGVEDFDINMSLSLVGIGAMLRSEDGMAKITQLIAGGPAEQDGRLLAGDKIIAVAQGDQEPVSILYWPLSKAVRLIRGEKGTKVVLTIIPADDASGARTKTIDLIRDEVKLEAQAAKGEVREFTETNGVPYRIGVLTLPEFYADFEAARNGDSSARRASTDVRRILGEFATNHLDGVILDLRNNGGGSLTEAIDIAGLFIPVGPVVQVREQRGVAVLPDGDPDTVYAGPLVVLVNRLSASASEIVAAALQDYGRAVIVGDSKTHGKGTVQTVYPLSKLTDELGSIKVTTASFYRIAGGSTQLKGVVPDIVLPSLYDSLEIGEEYLPHALPWSQVRSAYYRPWFESVKPAILEIKALSTSRMTNNPAFTTFLARRVRIRDRMNNPEVSLKISDRTTEIVAEKEMEKLQDEELQGDKADKEDPILDEALNITADLADRIGKKSPVQITKSESN
jgi:carboxyl-terminal processing protease